MTLVEVLVVLGVVSLMLGTLLVGFGAGRSAEVSGAVDRLANAIRYGFEKAKVTGSHYRLNMNLEKGTFTLQKAEQAMYLPPTDRAGKPYVIDPKKMEERDRRDKMASENYFRSIQAAVYAPTSSSVGPNGAPRGPVVGGFGSAPIGGTTGGALRPGGGTGGTGGTGGSQWRRPPRPPGVGTEGTGGTGGTAGTTGAAPVGATSGPAGLGAGRSSNPYDPYAVTAQAVPRRRPPLFESFEDENALTGLVKPITLPDGLKIIYVRSAEDAQPFTKGEAALYFFPQGRTQYMHIQLQDEETDIQYTIKVQPLTGKVTIIEGLEELKLPNDPTETKDELGKRQRRRTF
jgi:type II secretory pathway pseudopilin PulG